MKEKAQQLAESMTAHGLTPENEKSSPAYSAQHDMLSYYSEGGTTQLSSSPSGVYSLQRYKGQWVMFDNYGVRYVPIVWDGKAWRAGDVVSC